MSITPIYDQLVVERGEQRGPFARLQAFIAWTLDILAGVCGVGDIDSESVARRAVADAILFGPLMRSLVLEEPIYDGLVNEMGYPHCSPVEALVSYTHRPPASCREPWQRALVVYGPPITFRRWLTGDPE